MKKEINPELLKKFLRGETTPEESSFIDEWYQSFDKHKDDTRLQDSEEVQRLRTKIFDQVRMQINTSGKPHTRGSFSFTPLKWAASITILALIGAGVFFIWKAESQVIADLRTVDTILQAGKISNTTASILRQGLSDGSVVELHPNSTIEFPPIFSKTQREVQLTGEAFFDVTKDKDRPFIITTGDVTIRVLGTSFNVKAYQGAGEVTVAVKTGKVLVYSKIKSSPTVMNPSHEEIILSPNQEVVYDAVKNNFTKKLVNEPAIILAKPTLFEMKYDGTPVAKIFEVLEENYGIDIVFNEDMLAGCSLTTSMDEEGFYERIEIICKAIGAEYEITDSTILIKSRGCH